ncbi:hypothetical protein [Caldicellulosiruptor danielii]|uniref:Uncharacterized protein n=1 Tax=Anaerocellum danielii TaxID=1387557 RepID=A0ABZ0TZJ6_9FIRM|nr:hypothetical protein [Caldicellulosiruptor danielii]WPX08903.1 hypothetical protein SOJ16_000065 [Caldicellulosiruptor danielii]
MLESQCDSRTWSLSGKNLEKYSFFPTIGCGKLLAANLFTQVTVCLNIFSSLEKFGIGIKAVFGEIVSKNKTQQTNYHENF